MRYRLKGGGVVEGRTAADVVEALMIRCPMIDASEKEYMLGVARRCAIHNLSEVSAANATEFVKTLEASGFLHPQAEEKN